MKKAWPIVTFALAGLLTSGRAPRIEAMPIRTGPAQARLFVERLPDRQEAARCDTHQKYEPAVGCYLGAFIDFDGSLHLPVRGVGAHQDPAAFEALTGKPHAMYFFYMGYGRPLPLAWVRWLGAHGKFVHIALEPNGGMDKVNDDAYLHQLADDMARSGAKIFLRFASEMNGFWSVYHKDPGLYRRKFRLVHEVLRRRAPNVAMVWCPYMIPTANIASYYPGDDCVDWVGVNLYSVTYHNNTLSQPGENEHPCDLLDYVYRGYAARRPMMICEFAASHYAACEGRFRPEFACLKTLTLYAALPRLYPRVKCINYFDSNNLKFVGTGCNDYSVTDDPEVNAAYRSAVSPAYFLGQPLRVGPRSAPRPAPMPLYAGELLRGRVRLSCWVRAPSDHVFARYWLDGHRIYQANRPDLWAFDWDAASVSPGRHILMLEALRTDGKRAAVQSLAVSTAR